MIDDSDVESSMEVAWASADNVLSPVSLEERV